MNRKANSLGRTPLMTASSQSAVRGRMTWIEPRQLGASAIHNSNFQALGTIPLRQGDRLKVPLGKVESSTLVMPG